VSATLIIVSATLVCDPAASRRGVEGAAAGRLSAPVRRLRKPGTDAADHASARIRQIAFPHDPPAIAIKRGQTKKESLRTFILRMTI
jgi:hypothetical protein